MTHPFDWWWKMKLSEQLKYSAEHFDTGEFNPEVLKSWAKRAELLEDTIRIGRYKFDE